MEYTKQHPANTWETERELITSQIADTKASLNTLTAQASEAEVRKSSAMTLLDLLDDTRVNQQERAALRKLIAKSSSMLEIIGKQTLRVQARLTQWETRLESFPHAELAREERIRRARHKAGPLSQQASQLEKTLAFE
jgi:hypothetical protein